MEETSLNKIYFDHHKYLTTVMSLTLKNIYINSKVGHIYKF